MPEIPEEFLPPKEEPKGPTVADLSTQIARRAAVRAQLMRATIHLVSARDCLAFHPVTAGVLAKVFKTPWAAGLNGADRDAVVAAGLDALAERPHTRAELAELLAPRWPEADPPALAHAVTFNAALVQVPPRGLWGANGQATWAPADAFLAHTDADDRRHLRQRIHDGDRRSQ